MQITVEPFAMVKRWEWQAVPTLELGGAVCRRPAVDDDQPPVLGRVANGAPAPICQMC